MTDLQRRLGRQRLEDGGLVVELDAQVTAGLLEVADVVPAAGGVAPEEMSMLGRQDRVDHLFGCAGLCLRPRMLCQPPAVSHQIGSSVARATSSGCSSPELQRPNTC